MGDRGGRQGWETWDGREGMEDGVGDREWDI